MNRTELLAIVTYLVRSFASIVDRWPTTTWWLAAGWPLAVVLLVASGMRLW